MAVWSCQSLAEKTDNLDGSVEALCIVDSSSKSVCGINGAPPSPPTTYGFRRIKMLCEKWKILLKEKSAAQNRKLQE